MKRRITAWMLCCIAVLVSMSSIAATAAEAKMVDTWVAYNSKNTFYIVQGDEKDQLRRIDQHGNEKIIFTGKDMVNIVHCTSSSIFFTMKTESFKTLATDEADKASEHGVFHLDLIVIDLVKGRKKVLLSNIPLQKPYADGNYIYYTLNRNNVSRIKFDGTGAQTYKSIDATLKEQDLLSNGNRYLVDWENGSCTITRRNGSQKKVPGFPVITDSYVFSWQKTATDDEFKYTLFRYDLNGEKKTRLPYMRNQYITKMIYHKEHFYYISDTDGDFVPNAIRKMDMNGKIKSSRGVKKMTAKSANANIYVTDKWIFIYDDPSGSGYFSEYLGKVGRS